jgi:mannose-6-phosphate isomerase-like protein (cupin superfamily)
MSEVKLPETTNNTQAKLIPAEGGVLLHPTSGEDVFLKAGVDETAGLFDYFEIRVSYLDGPPLHTHLFQYETFHILEGELLVQVGEELIEAKTGDYVIIPRGVPHTYTNLKQERARAVGNFAPGGFGKFLVELDAYRKSVPVPDPAVIAEISARHNQVFDGPPLAVKMGLSQIP